MGSRGKGRGGGQSLSKILYQDHRDAFAEVEERGGKEIMIYDDDWEDKRDEDKLYPTIDEESWTTILDGIEVLNTEKEQSFSALLDVDGYFLQSAFRLDYDRSPKDCTSSLLSLMKEDQIQKIPPELCQDDGVIVPKGLKTKQQEQKKRNRLRVLSDNVALRNKFQQIEQQETNEASKGDDGDRGQGQAKKSGDDGDENDEDGSIEEEDSEGDYEADHYGESDDAMDDDDHIEATY